MRRKEDNIKILFAGRFNDGKILSGPERISKDIFEEYTKHYSTFFLQYFFDGRKYSITKKLFGKHSVNSGKAQILTLGSLRLIPFLISYRPGIIHLTVFERFAVILYIYKIFFRTEIIYSSHGIIKHENSVIKNLGGWLKFKDNFCEKIFIKYSDKVIFPSEAAKQTAERYYSISPDRIKVIPNCIDNRFYEMNKIFPGTQTIKAVTQYKNSLNRSGCEMLLSALNGIKCKIEINLITNENIELPDFKNVTFLKYKMMPHDSLAEFYIDKDLFLSLNSFDTFSISTAEAMASGLIPIVTIETGISAHISGGKNGFKVKYGEVSELAEILNIFSEMKSEEKLSICNEAKKTAENFRSEKVLKMYAGLYRERLR